VLALERELIPPSLHFETPNPRIDFAGSPFFVNALPRHWPRGTEPRRAAVHTYAVGGTNTHLILEEAPPRAPATASRAWQLLPLSARTTTALHEQSERLAGYLDRPEADGLPDVAYTLKVGRRPFAARRVVLCRDRAEALAALDRLDPARVADGLAGGERRAVGLLLPGEGRLAADAAAELYAAEPDFRTELDACAELLAPTLGADLRHLLGCARAPAVPASADARTPGSLQGAQGQESRQDAAADLLSDPRFAEPALCAFGYALGRLWMQWGVAPQAFFGWGAGELAAACLAGALALGDALALAAARGRALSACPPGSRLEVAVGPADLSDLLCEEIAVEAVVGPTRCRVAGPGAAIEVLQERLNELGIDCLHLGAARCAARMPEEARAAWRQALAAADLRPAARPLVGSPTGAVLQPAEAAQPAFWERQLTAPAQLAAGLGALAGERGLLLLAAGPEPEPDAPWAAAAPAVVAALGRPEGQPAPADPLPAPARLLAALGRLWLAGVEIDWAGFYRHERRLRVPLPTYAFERRRIWAQPKIGRDQAIWRQAAAGARRELSEWFYAPSWRRSEQPAPAGAPLAPGTWVLFADAGGLGDRLAERLRGRGCDAVAVRPGLRLFRDDRGDYEIDPWRFDDYAALLADLAGQGREPAVAVHLWGVAPGAQAPHPPGNGNGGLTAGFLDSGGLSASSLDFGGLAADCSDKGGLSADCSDKGGLSADCSPVEDLCFWSLHHLGRALGERAVGEVRLEVVAAGTQEVTGEEPLHPARASCLSACKVIPREYPRVACRSIDVAFPAPGSQGEERLVEQLAGELGRAAAEPVVALRGGRRWVQGSERLAVEEPAGPAPRLRQGGVYLIAGALRGFGLLVAGHLARAVGARLALVGDSGLPPREHWDAWLAAAPAGDDTARVLREIRGWEEMGAEVLLAEADLADPAQVRAAVAHVRRHFGALHGVFHAAAEQGEELARPIARLDREFYDYRLRARLAALPAIEEALRGEEIDFVLLASTVASVVGGEAVAVECLADTFLDLFARRQSRLGGTPWTSVDWDAFRLPGAPPAAAPNAIALEEAAGAFALLLAMPPLPQVIVSTVDLEERLAAAGVRALPAAAEAPAESRERPPLRTTFVTPRTEVERQVADIWAEVLGVREVGVEDDFFDLGGNSLVATQLVSRLRSALQINLALQDFFAGATVAAVAERASLTHSLAQALARPALAVEEMGEI